MVVVELGELVGMGGKVEEGRWGNEGTVCHERCRQSYHRGDRKSRIIIGVSGEEIGVVVEVVVVVNIVVVQLSVAGIQVAIVKAVVVEMSVA